PIRYERVAIAVGRHVLAPDVVFAQVARDGLALKQTTPQLRQVVLRPLPPLLRQQQRAALPWLVEAVQDGADLRRGEDDAVLLGSLGALPDVARPPPGVNDPPIVVAVVRRLAEFDGAGARLAQQAEEEAGLVGGGLAFDQVHQLLIHPRLT